MLQAKKKTTWQGTVPNCVSHSHRDEVLPFFRGKTEQKKRFMETNGCCELSFNSYRPDEKENHFCFLRGHSFSLLKVNFRRVQVSN